MLQNFYSNVNFIDESDVCNKCAYLLQPFEPIVKIEEDEKFIPKVITICRNFNFLLF